MDGERFNKLEDLIEAVLIQEANENLPEGIHNADVYMLALRIADQASRWYSRRTV